MANGFGREAYADYYYLWHLIALGVLQATPPALGACPTITGAVWDTPAIANGRPITVALIDMGIAPNHPNLDGPPPAAGPPPSQIDRANALDLATHRYGARYVDGPAGHLEGRAQHLAAINPGLIATATPPEQDVLNRLQAGLGVIRPVHVYDRHYASHGTACAGLVAGTVFAGDATGLPGGPAAYYGVAPFARVLPITTSVAPDPEQLIAAFLYAHARTVDVILFPRDAGDLGRQAHYDVLDANERTRLDESAEATMLWALFGKVIERVSQDIPVVCAAGNDGRSQPIYPASLAGDPANGIIAVGAVSHVGFRSGYANYGPGLTCVAPADDGEVYNRHQLRLDKQAPEFLDTWVDAVHTQPPVPAEIPFSHQRLITLDVPGPRGYAEGSRRGRVRSRDAAVDDPGGLYAEFGGTSGATALAAGMVALMQRKSANRIGGPAIKATIVGVGTETSLADWYWTNEAHLRLDAINGPPAPAAADLFGAGGLLRAANLV